MIYSLAIQLTLLFSRDLAIARLLYTTLPPFLHILFLLSNMCLLGCLLTISIYWSLVFLFCACVLGHVVVVLMLRAHVSACPRLCVVAGKDYVLLRVLAHNGAGIYVVCVAAAALYQVNMLCV